MFIVQLLYQQVLNMFMEHNYSFAAFSTTFICAILM